MNIFLYCLYIQITGCMPNDDIEYMQDTYEII